MVRAADLIKDFKLNLSAARESAILRIQESVVRAESQEWVAEQDGKARHNNQHMQDGESKSRESKRRKTGGGNSGSSSARIRSCESLATHGVNNARNKYPSEAEWTAAMRHLKEHGLGTQRQINQRRADDRQALRDAVRARGGRRRLDDPPPGVDLPHTPAVRGELILSQAESAVALKRELTARRFPLPRDDYGIRGLTKVLKLYATREGNPDSNPATITPRVEHETTDEAGVSIDFAPKPKGGRGNRIPQLPTTEEELQRWLVKHPVDGEVYFYKPGEEEAEEEPADGNGGASAAEDESGMVLTGTGTEENGDATENEAAPVPMEGGEEGSESETAAAAAAPPSPEARRTRSRSRRG